jgi:hypothetical protein
MPTQSPREPAAKTTGTSHAPRPITPVDNTPVDGSAAPFSWEPVPGAMAYRLQVGADAEFRQTHFDAEVGNTTTLTLYELLPESNASWYWRVQARDAQGWQGWSPAARFRPVSDDEAMAYETAQATAASTQRARSTQAATPTTYAGAVPATDLPIPVLEGRTSSTEVFVAIFVGLLSFFITAFLIARFALQM